MVEGVGIPRNRSDQQNRDTFVRIIVQEVGVEAHQGDVVGEGGKKIFR